MPDPVMPIDINIRSMHFLLARTGGACRHCRRSTQLFALALPPGHETLILDEEATDDGLAADRWQGADHNAFIFHIGFLPDAIRNLLRRIARTYRTARNDSADCCWTNFCSHCGSSLGDQELFCEPEGAFVPTSESSAGAIHLLRIEHPFSAAAAGYTHEPPFFDCMNQG